ncbi:MAG: AraC family transcriptional regulator [Halieaceae bacterium]
MLNKSRASLAMIAQKFSTIGPLGVVIWQALEDLGVAPEPLFAEAGIEVGPLLDPNTRIADGAFRELLKAIEVQASVQTFGLHLAKFIHPTTFYSLGVAAYCSATLGDYVEKMVRYYSVVTTNDVMSLVREADGCALIWTAHNPEPFPPIREDGIAAIFVTILRIASQNRFRPRTVSLARPYPADEAPRYEMFFGCEVMFDAAETSITFDSELLDLPLVGADPELARSYEQLTEQYIAKLEKADFPARVRNELVRLLPTGVSGKEAVASVLCVSTRTLYNRLEEAGTTFREVLDETRRLLAEDYLKKGLPVNEIAYLTGFSDTANFSRAFKKWTGLSPMAYRAETTSSGDHA